MSTFRSVEEMPPFLVPREYLDRFPEAAGKKTGLKLWRLGEGLAFFGPVTSDLALHARNASKPAHGALEPSRPMLLGTYQAALAATSDQWVAL